MRQVISFKSLWGMMSSWVFFDVAMILWGQHLPTALQFDGLGALNRDISTCFFIAGAWLIFRESVPPAGTEG